MFKNKTEEEHEEKNEILELYESLLQKYQDKPKTFIKDFDDVIYRTIVSIICLDLSADVLRTEIINDVATLITIRPFVINYYSNDSGSQN